MPKSTWGLAAAILMLLTLACNFFTPQSVCTPPACRADEVYFCPGDCPGGCGTTCATPTPGETTLPPQCTPPACRADEVYFCPGDCPGGCGTTCATPTPLSPQESPPVVYTHSGNLWLVEGTLPPRPLTNGGGDSEPRFSPNGRWVLFRRELPPGPADLPRFELYVVGIDGSGERRLVGPEQLPGELGQPAGAEQQFELDRLPLQVAWLPDNSGVAFNTRVDYGVGLSLKNDLWVVDLTTGALAQRLPDGQGGTFAFSPNGFWLALSTSKEVAMLRADGTDRRTLVTFPAVNTASEYAYVPLPVWAPDSSYALVGISSQDPFGQSPSGTLWRLPVSGEAVQLTTLSGMFLFNTMEDSLWSPDRTQLAYEDNGTLFIAGWDGSTPRAYVSGNARFIGWAPGHSRFAFWQTEPTEVWIGEPGQVPQRVTSPTGPAAIADLRWVDENTYVYVTGEPEAYTLGIGTVGGLARDIAISNSKFVSLDVRP